MTTVTSTIRSHAWNILICDYPLTYKSLAGAFQSIEEPFLTWKDLFHDLLLCFHLETYVAASDARLALYLLNGDDVLVDKLGIPFVYYPGPEEQLSKYIKLKALNGPESLEGPTTGLKVCLVCHNVADCKEAKAELAHHLQFGCARKIILKRNPTFRFLPIPSGSRSELVSPNVSTLPSPVKRPRLSGPGRSVPASNPSSQSLTPIASTPPTSTHVTKMTVPPELEMETKQNYKGKCVITGFDSAWGPLIAGPGIETCHIVPKAMFDWYGYPDIEMSSQQKWDAVNSPDNCITMESFSHTIHDNRLLAIHPISHKIRLFAPIKPLEGRNNKPANFPSQIYADDYALKWHYQQTVVENMCALFLRREGGARRVPWRGGPNSIITANEEDHPEVGGFPQATFPARTQGPTGKETSAAGGGGGELLEDMGPLRHMSADVETDDHDEFVAELHDRLLEESMYQESLDNFACGSDGAGADCRHTSQKVSRVSWKSYVTELRHNSCIPLIGGEMMNEMSADKVATASSENFAIGMSKKSERQLRDNMARIILAAHERRVTFTKQSSMDLNARPISVKERD